MKSLSNLLKASSEAVPLPVSFGGTGTALISGLIKGNSTSAFSAAQSGIDFIDPFGSVETCTVDGIEPVGFRNLPINLQTGNYITVLTDSGKCIYHPSSDANARTFTINNTLSYRNGTAINFVNMASQNLSISISSGTMTLAGTASTTGTRTLTINGSATAIKLESNVWLISGVGIT